MFLWKIATFYKDSKALSLDFDFCSFCWDNREANLVVHALIKYAFHQLISFSCNNDFLSPFGIEAWSRDVVSVWQLILNLKNMFSNPENSPLYLVTEKIVK